MLSRMTAACLFVCGVTVGANALAVDSVTLYGDIDEYLNYMRHANSGNGGWRPAGSAGLPYNCTNPADVNGRSIDGVQVGILHRFRPAPAAAPARRRT